MLNDNLKYISLITQLFQKKEPLEKAIEGFKLITRTPLEDSYDLFRALYESLQQDQSHFQGCLKAKIDQVLNSEPVKFEVSKACISIPSEKLVLAFYTAAGGHMAHRRKGMLERPYLHHVLMVWYLVALCGGNLNQQIAALLHDYPEDVPDETLALSTVRRMFNSVFGKTATKYTFSLKNKEGLSGKTPEKAMEKHAWQLNHLAKMIPREQLIKICDRLANLYDMRRDGPASNNPVSIQKEIAKWNEFQNVCNALPPLVYSFFEYIESLLKRKYSLS